MSNAPDTSPRPKTPRRRRVGLWALFSVAALTLAVLVAGFAVLGRPVIAPDWLRERIEARIATAVPGVRLAFGQMSFVVEEGWQPRLVLRDVEVGEIDGPPLITLSDMQGTLALKPLFQGRLQPQGIWLTGAYLRLRRDSGGGFDVAFGDASRPVRQAATLAGLIEGLDRVLVLPQLSSLDLIEADALALRYEDARADKAWSVDGGRVQLVRDGDNLQLRGDFALLSGRDYATSLEMNYVSRIGQAAADFGMAFQDMPADDIASQTPALAWLKVLKAPIAGALRASVDEDGALGPLSATLQIGAGVLQPTEETVPIPFEAARSYFTYSPSEQMLQFDELSVQSKWVSARAEGRAFLVGMEKGWPSEMLGQFSLSDIKANPDDLYPEPIQLEGATMDMRLRLDPFTLSLGEMTLADQGQKLVVRGELKAQETGWDLALAGRIDALAPERLKALWPTRISENTRNWIDENVLAGTLSNIQIGLRSKPASRPEVYLGFDFSGLDTRFLKFMPPIRSAAGHATLHRNRFVVVADKGQVTAPQGGKVEIAGTSFIVPNVREKPTPAEVHLVTGSTITAALALLDVEPWGFLTKAGQPVTLADGRADLTGRVGFQLVKDAPPDAVQYAIQGRLSDVRSEAVVPGRVLAASSLQVDVNTDRLRIDGAGRIGQVRFEGAFNTELGPKNASGKSLVSGWVELSEKFVEEFKIGLPAGSVSGLGRADVQIDLERDKRPLFTLDSKLEGVGLRLAPLGWSKTPRSNGSLKVSGSLGSPPSIDAIRLDAPGLSAAGTVTLNAAGQLQRAQFSRVRAGGWLDAPVELIGRGANATPAVRVTGGTIDMRKTSVGGGSSSGGSGGGGPISLSLDRLQISDGISLSNFKGDFSNIRGMEGRFSGLVNGGAPITGQVVPQKGRSAFRILSKDAGGVLRSAGLLKQARGGDMSLTLLPSGQQGSYNGTLKVTDTRLQDAPAMAALLSAISVVGLLEQLTGNGILFAEVDGSFRLTPTQVIVTKSSAVGTSMGISMDGIYDLGSGRMDMQGVVSPFYLVNGIGSILTRKGEGLIGFNYRLLGTSAAPRVQVNPLSIFTPGMFRELFRRPPPKVDP